MVPAPLANGNLQPSPPIPLSPIRARSSQIRSYIVKRRWWLCIAVVLVIIAMIISIIFAAHKYYVSFGGQGFLRTRNKFLDLPVFFLPARPVRLEGKLKGRGNVPYYTCGDQLRSCEAFNRPNVCCPVKTYCHATTLSLSGIFCCNATSPSNCRTSIANPPRCIENTFQCSADTGGACCKRDTICTPNGCIQITAASIINDESIPRPSSFLETYSPFTSTMDGSVAAITGIFIVSTVMEQPAATSTVVKLGEVAQNGASHQRLTFMSLCVPYFSTSLVGWIVLMMGYL